jgi:hypothetical protein
LLFVLFYVFALIVGCVIAVPQFVYAKWSGDAGVHGGIFSGSPGSSSSSADGSSDRSKDAQNASMVSSLDRLTRLADATCTIFSVSSDDILRMMAASGAGDLGLSGGELRDSGYAGSLGEEGEVIQKEVAPGVLSPDTYGKDRLFLTSAGRHQIKRGLRKCSPDDVPPILTERVQRIAHSYEIVWAVNKTIWIANKFDEWVRMFAFRVGNVPHI